MSRIRRLHKKQLRTLVKNRGYVSHQQVVMKGDCSLQHLKPEENSALSYLRLNMILSNEPGTHRNYTN